MAAGQAPIPTPFPKGYPRAAVAGRSLALGFFIPGDPVPKDRPRGRVIAGPNRKPFVQFYTDKKTVDYEDSVGQHALVQLRAVEVDGDEDFTLPVRDSRIIAHLRFNLKKPVSYPKSVKHATKKPDLDNLVKTVLDGLVKGGVIDDDNCVTDISMMKRYADDDHPVGVEVDLTVLPV